MRTSEKRTHISFRMRNSKKTNDLKRDCVLHAKVGYNLPMSTLSSFLFASGRWAMASDIAAMLTFIIGMWEHAHSRSLTAFILVCVSVPLFWMGAYLAWRREYIANREGPEIVLEWETSGRGSTRRDLATLKNIGKQTAVCVKIGDFSWPDLIWGRHIEVQTIDAGQKETIEAHFGLEHLNGLDLGYMDVVLKERNRPPLTVTVAFLNMNSIEFCRTFLLNKGSDGGPSIVVTPGALKTRRLSS